MLSSRSFRLWPLALAASLSACSAAPSDDEPASPSSEAAVGTTSEALSLVRATRVQMSSLMLDKFYHARGVERLVRNSVFEGRTAEEFYDRLSWLYRSPAYVRG